MTDAANPKSWWQTLPGIITGLTAIVTALAGLVVAIQQTGWLGPGTPTSPSRPPATTSAPPASAPPATPAPAPPAPAAAPPSASRAASAPATAARAPVPVALPALREYKFPGATITLLKSEVVPRTTESDELRFRLRMLNHDRFDKNFWDQSFRLILDGVPRAPESGLNELVPGESAQDGDVFFVIPRGTTAVQLRIRIGEKHTEIPLDLPAPS
jgi:hypothetical protein